MRLDPNNRDAHEYLGEAYLQVNDLDNARKQLDVLDKLCPDGCSQQRELKEAIAAYEASNG